MTCKFQFITLLLISILTFSCSSDDDLDYQNDFKKSQQAWLNFKESSNNSYKYVVSGGSVFTTYGWETTIIVSNGVIIQRAFSYTGNPENFPENGLEWTENGNEINSEEHQGTSAATALTLEDIYTKAENDWLIKRKHATSYFETGNNGLISMCGYVEDGCMDDCFTGIHIKSIDVYNPTK